MPDLTSSRIAAAGALLGGAAFSVAGALQATGLRWKENAVETPTQHLTMALFSVGLVAVVPAAALLARYAGSRTRRGWIGIAVGQIGVAIASAVSNVRGVDASWFPAVAVAANLAWIAGTLTLALGLYRAARLPRLAAAGLVVAYLGAIPLATHGGGLLTGAYWLAIGYAAGLGGLERRTIRPATL